MATKADGSVIIEVDANTSKAQKEIKELEKEIAETQKKLSDKPSREERVKKAQEARSNLDKARANNASSAEIQRLTTEWGNAIKQIKEYDDALESIEQKQKRIADLSKTDVGGGYTVSTKENWKNAMSQVGANIVNTFKAIPSAALSAVKTGLGAVKNVFKTTFTKIVPAIGKAVKNLNMFSKVGEKLSGVFKRLGRVIMSSLVFSVIYKGLSMVKQQVSSYLKTNADFMTALSRVKGALLTAFQPIYDVIVPALTTLLNIITRVLGAITSFTAALFGTTAKAAQKNAKALNQQAKATEAAGSAAEEAEGQLASFDEINTLTTENKGGGGGGVEAGAATFDVELDDTKFKTWGEAFNAFLDRIISNLPKLDSALERAAGKINEFSAKLLEMFTADGVLTKTRYIGTELANIINRFFDNVNWEQLGRALGAGLNWAIVLGVSFLYNVDWLGIGNSFAQLVNGIVYQIDWYEFGRLLWAGFKIGIETLAGFILGADASFMAQSASNLVIGFVNSITETLANIDWVGIGHQIQEFLVNIDWAGIATAVFEAFGAALAAGIGLLWGFIEDAWNELVEWWNETAIEDGQFTMDGLLEGIWNVISNIGQWIEDNIFTPFINGFKKVFGIASPSKVMNEQGEFIMQGLLDGVESMISSVTEVFTNLKKKVLEIFDSLWGGLKEVINSILGGVEWMANKIINGINAVIRALNRISFTMPSWLGGGTFGFNIGTLSNISIPRLAEGAVIPPNREFMAVLGDQKQGTNIEAPLDTIKQALSEVLQDGTGGIIEVKLYLDGKQIAKNSVKHINTMTMAAGKPVLLT